MYIALYLPPRAVTSQTVDATCALVQLARDHSPRIEVHGSQLVMMDAGGLGHLWGTPREMGAALRRTAAARGFMVRVAVAATRVAALLAVHGRSGLTVVPPGKEAEKLAPFPLVVLKRLAETQAHSTSSGSTPSRVEGSASSGLAHATHPAQVGRLRGGRSRPAQRPASGTLALPAFTSLPIVERWGLKTLGELAALPSGELYERLGGGGLELQRLARGEDTRPLVPEPVEERLEETLELEWPVEGLEPLSFVLGRVLEPLCARLERQEAGAGTLQLRLMLVTRATHERVLRLPAPIRDARVLRTLILLDLETHPPSAGIDRVTVAVEPVSTRVLQFSLLERAVPSAARLSTLLARLSVLMGERRCGAPALVDTHQPDAFEMREFAPGVGGIGEKSEARAHWAGAHPSPPPGLGPLIPVLRRFRAPVAARVAVDRGQPVRVVTGQQQAGSGRIVACAGPWRSSGQWWMSPGARDQEKNEERRTRNEERGVRATAALRAWDRDEWDVALSDGGVYRLFRARERDRWFVEGMVD